MNRLDRWDGALDRALSRHPHLSVGAFRLAQRFIAVLLVLLVLGLLPSPTPPERPAHTIEWTEL